MKRLCKIRIIALIMLVLFAGVAITMKSLASASRSQAEQTYVLTAGQWSDEQNAVGSEAGGAVTFSHRNSGIGVVSSSAPDFLDRALASGKFTGGGADQVVQWQLPTHTMEFGEAGVTPGDETFINLQWNIRAIEAPAAWAAGFDGAGVRVAVIDGGIYSAHQDLDGNLDVVASRSFVPGFPFNQDVGTFWHGTHVAGIIAAEDNALGTIGVAPRVTIIGYPDGATNFRRPASYTNFGNSAIWVAAPGGDFVYMPTSPLCSIPIVPSGSVTTNCRVFDLVISTVRGSAASTTAYGFAAGTSMAAPVASGVAALIKQRFPNISVGALKNRLAQTADDEGSSGHDPFYGRGFVNARRAVGE